MLLLAKAMLLLVKAARVRMKAVKMGRPCMRDPVQEVKELLECRDHESDYRN
jgi:hypothetical protein